MRTGTKTPPRVALTLRVPKKLRDQIARRAQEEHRSINSQVLVALAEHVEGRS